MRVDVNGTTLWFDVDGPALVPDGRRMRQRPTILLIHGGPGSYDHSYFKPWFSALTDIAQVVYLDLREHGRSGRRGAAGWSFEACADDVSTFCAVLGIDRPVVLGHSMGGFVAILHAARHPSDPGAVILASTMARFDLDRITEGFRAVGGDDVAALARRDYGDDPVTDRDWARVFAAFGPNVPDEEALARRVRSDEVALVGSEQFGRLDLLGQLPLIAAPVLVVVGERDPVTDVDASREIASGLRPGIGRLVILERAGHFPWLDDADGFFDAIRAFVRTSLPAVRARS
jgi:proline iminopeptidase